MEGDYQKKIWRDAGGWCSGESRNNFGIGLWKEIWKDWEGILKDAKFVIGDGSRVRF